MNKIILTLICAILGLFTVAAQEFPISTVGTLYTACSGSFTDDGGLAGDYLPGTTTQATICSPFLTDQASVSFNLFDLAPGSVLIAYDGPDVSAPVLGAFTANNPPALVTSSVGVRCLTFVFRSSTLVSQGFEATIACIDSCQTLSSFVDTVPARDPDDLLRICQGDTVQFTGMPSVGDPTGLTYEYVLSDGSVVSGQNASETFPNEGIYSVDFVIRDPSGCRDRTLEDVKILVSTTPDFTGTQASDSTVCFGDTVTLTGMAESVQFLADVAPAITGQTFLPDGANDPEYITCIEVSGFPANQVITNGSDLISMFMNIEHSYMGDLDITLTAPDGSSIQILTFPNGGGGTFLGDALDDGSLNPGVGFVYTITESGMATGTMAAGAAGVATLPEGDYLPEDPFSNFIGTPLNGQWCLSIQDFLAIDNGYIFEWGLNFDPAIVPTAGSFEPMEVTEMWQANPDIVSTNGSDIVVMPSVVGQNCYNFEFNDDFGCTYVETVCVEMAPEITSAEPTPFNFCEGSPAIDVDLTTRTLEILNGLSSLNYRISYHLTEADAEVGLNPITSPTVFNVSSSTIVYARVFEPTVGCVKIEELRINFTQNTANPVANVEICDDLSQDGTEVVDLTAQIAQALGGQSDTEVAINIYLNAIDAAACVNAVGNTTNFQINTGTITLFYNAKSLIDPTCFSTNQFDITLNTLPNIGTAADLTVCDEAPLTRSEFFDLELQNTAVYNGLSTMDYSIAYFEDRQDAIDDVDDITNINNYEAANGQVITARLTDNATGCFNISQFTITVLNTPAAGTAPDIVECDDAPSDGVLDIDLTVQDSFILDGLSDADFTVQYFPSPADADLGSNELFSPYTAMDGDVITALLTDNNTMCSSTSQFAIEILSTPTVGTAPDLVDCDVFPLDGMLEFDLSLQDSSILNGQSASDFTVAYFLSEADADNDVNQLPTLYTATDGDVIIARVMDNQTGCINTSQFTITVESCDLILPQGISPNGDGTNEFLDIVNIQQFNNFELKVFNRYGSLVYETQAASYLPFAGVSNTGSSDNLLPVGTYFYTIKFNSPIQEDIAKWLYVNY
ncbi:MAG: gliding motility-associated C-terminal domain-containing protein [Nonlabens sp.]